MKLEKKKELAARALGIGKGRISFFPSRLEEIKSAITKQDMKDLASSGAIIIKEIRGRRKVQGRKYRRRPGRIKKKIKQQNYITLARKLRQHLLNLRSKKQISDEAYYKFRKEIKANEFKNLAHFKEVLK